MSRVLPAATMPHLISPMLASSARPFDDEQCVFELKWDGVRALASVSGGTFHLWGRDLQDYTPRYPELSCLRNLPDGTVLDGELVLIRNGRAEFHALMARHRARSRLAGDPITYIVFDILNCSGRSLLRLPFSERRAILEETVPCTPLVTWCDGIVGTGRVFFEQAIAAGHEGIVAKRLDATYSPGKRKTAWRKIKQVVDGPVRCDLLPTFGRDTPGSPHGTARGGRTSLYGRGRTRSAEHAGLPDDVAAFAPIHPGADAFLRRALPGLVPGRSVA